MTGDPLRLLHDPATAAVLRRDLGAASGGVGYDVDAGLARLQSSLAADLAPGTGGGSVGLGASGGLTLGALVVARGLAALLGWQLAGPDPEPRTLVVTRGEGVARVAAPTPTIVSAQAPDLIAPEVTEVTEVDEDPVLPAGMKYPRVRRIRGARNEASALPGVAATGDALREARALNVARGLLGVDAAQALALAEAGASEYRAGTFAPEWEGVAVLALFELGRETAARTRADAYLARHPSGTYAPRIRQAIEARR